MYKVWHNVCRNNYSHIVVYENNCSQSAKYKLKRLWKFGAVFNEIEYLATSWSQLSKGQNLNHQH